MGSQGVRNESNCNWRFTATTQMSWWGGGGGGVYHISYNPNIDKTLQNTQPNLHYISLLSISLPCLLYTHTHTHTHTPLTFLSLSHPPTHHQWKHQQPMHTQKDKHSFQCLWEGYGHSDFRNVLWKYCLVVWLSTLAPLSSRVADFQYRYVAQAADCRTLIALSRSRGADPRFFLPQPPLVTSKVWAGVFCSSS